MKSPGRALAAGGALLIGEASYLGPRVQRVSMCWAPPYPPAVNPLADLQQAACPSHLSALIEATDSGDITHGLASQGKERTVSPDQRVGVDDCLLVPWVSQLKAILLCFGLEFATTVSGSQVLSLSRQQQ